MRITVSQVDGLTEQINDGSDGFLADFANTTKASQKLLAILNLDEASLSKVVEKGYERAMNNYNLQKNLSNSISQLITI